MAYSELIKNFNKIRDYMSFRQENSGKISFISVDSSKVRANPLYNAFKAKSFTANDIVLNFCILDILRDGVKLGVAEITDRITEEYMSVFDVPKEFDEALVRNKLREYADEGILTKTKENHEVSCPAFACLYEHGDRTDVSAGPGTEIRAFQYVPYGPDRIGCKGFPG